MRYSPLRHLPSVFWKSQPIQFTFFLTARCNARCRFCFYLSREGARTPAERELSLPEIREISRSLGPLLWLAFSGGEVFLREDIADVVQVFYETNRPVIILLPTNGLLPSQIRDETEKILRRCPRSTVVVKLSLDGLGQVHDRLRGVSGAFEKVMESYGRLRELASRYGNLELGVNTVFCRENQDGVVPLIQHVGALPAVRTHTISLVRGAVADPALKNVDMAKYRAAAALLKHNARAGRNGTYAFRGGRFKTAQDILQREFIEATGRERKPQVPCTAGRLTLVMTEEGELYPCEAFDRPLGNVRRAGYDIRNVLADPAAQALVRTIRENGCWCTHECYMMMNIFFNPGLYPRLGREFLALAPRGRPASGSPVPIRTGRQSQ